MPVIGLGHWIPGPIGRFRVGEDDARAFEFLIAVAPHVEVAFGGSGQRLSSRLEPRVLIRGVVDDQLDHHLHAAPVRGLKECLELVQGAVARIDTAIVGNVVAIVAHGRGEEGQEPQAGDT